MVDTATSMVLTDSLLWAAGGSRPGVCRPRRMEYAHHAAAAASFTRRASGGEHRGGETCAGPDADGGVARLAQSLPHRGAPAWPFRRF